MFVRSCVSTVAALVIASGAAQASLFSFASDSNSTQWTFAGTAGGTPTSNSFTINSGVTTPLSLYVDDNNGPQPSIPVSAVMQANLVAHFAGMTPLSGSLFLYNYTIDGTIDFVNPSNTAEKYVSIAIGNVNPGQQSAVFTVTGGPNSWNSVAALQGASSYAGVTYSMTQAYANLIQAQAALGGSSAAAYGVAAGSIATGTDFSFDLTVINSGSTGVNIGPSVALGDNHLPTQAWRSESSFSGSANIPAPTSLGLLGLGGLVAIRRRRA